MRSIKAALVMGLIWAVAGALVGGVMELAANFFPALNVIDMWIQPLAMMAFTGGAAFSVVLGIAARKRKFEDLSVAQFGLWGAIGGVAVGGLFVASGIAGPLILLPMTLLSTVLASGTLAIARRGEKQQLGAGGQSDRGA